MDWARADQIQRPLAPAATDPPTRRVQTLQARFDRMARRCPDGRWHVWGPPADGKVRECQHCGHLVMQSPQSVKGFRTPAERDAVRGPRYGD